MIDPELRLRTVRTAGQSKSFVSAACAGWRSLDKEGAGRASGPADEAREQGREGRVSSGGRFTREEL